MTSLKTAKPGQEPADAEDPALMQIEYFGVVALAERVHRQFLSLIQQELDRRGLQDISSVQALMLHNMGAVRMTVSELMWRGCYLGSNVSYNLKKLTEHGYILQERSAHDRRVILVEASAKGGEIREMIRTMNMRHIADLAGGAIDRADLAACRQTLHGLHQFWNRVTEPGAPPPMDD